MAARSRFQPESKVHDEAGSALRRSKTYNVLVGRWKSFRRRRILFVLIAGWLLYLFFKNMPTDVPPISQRYDSRYGLLRPGAPAPPGPGPHENANSDYDGAIRYFDLAQTLEEHMWMHDVRGNVLFAVSSLNTMPYILPVACSMAQRNRTRVHIAFMGRDAAAWEDIRAKNGILEADCNVSLHDARPDHSTTSSIARLGVSAKAGLGHIHAALKLKVVMALDGEAQYFLDALRDKASSAGLPFLKLPTNGLQSLSWISFLDGISLPMLTRISLDIVIQAQIESAASLVRLLRSIKNADYSGWSLPRVTIELPNDIDPFLGRYLADFEWPRDRLVIRHRLDAKLMSPVQASMRTVESFYPLAPSTSHLLLLTPNIELSSNYFQFLMYAILQYRHSEESRELSAQMVGIALDLPSLAVDSETVAPYESPGSAPLTLWQAPLSTAALYFGDRWVEMHTFLSYRLLLDPELKQRTPSAPDLSHQHPAWLRSMHEMMQTQGYYMLYPSFMLSEGSAAVTLHRELAQSSEEFLVEESKAYLQDESPKLDLHDGRTLTADEELARLMKAEQRAFPASLVAPLIESLYERHGNQTSPYSSVPLYSFRGELQSPSFSGKIAWQAAQDFATSVGGCKTYDEQRSNAGASGLFCTEAG